MAPFYQITVNIYERSHLRSFGIRISSEYYFFIKEESEKPHCRGCYDPCRPGLKSCKAV